MSVKDLVFSYSADSQTVYDPAKVSSSTQFTVTNFGDEDLTNLGLWIVPATNVGDVDFPADFAPETDYDDLLTWGTKVDLGIEITGGVKLTVPQNTGTAVEHVTRTQGALRSNKIPFVDLAAGNSAQFTVTFETPSSGEPARRFYIDLVLE